MMNRLNAKSIYQIRIDGHLQEKWADWFNGMILELTTSDREAGQTTIRMNVPDQAALRGVMNQIWDLNLNLISVTLIEE